MKQIKVTFLTEKGLEGYRQIEKQKVPMHLKMIINKLITQNLIRNDDAPYLLITCNKGKWQQVMIKDMRLPETIPQGLEKVGCVKDVDFKIEVEE